MPFSFESSGSQIIFYEPEREDYAKLEKDRAARMISSFKELKSIEKQSNIEDIIQTKRNKADTESIV